MRPYFWLGPLHATPLLALLIACGSPPEGGSVSITPDAPRTSDDLSATVGEAPVPTNDRLELSYTWSWTVDDQIVSDLTDATVPASRTAKGETWTATAIASDGKRLGAPFSASVVVVNTPPTASVTVAPAQATTSDDLVASTTGSDEDGDEVTFTLAWSQDGMTLDDLTEATVPAARTARGEVWTVTATPSDDEGAGGPATATVTIGNTAPDVLEVQVAPSEAYTTSTLVASADVDDADDDDTTLSWRWLVDGAEVPALDSDTLGPGYFVKGQRVVAEAVPSDGDLTGTAVRSAEVIILNSPPSVASAALSPAAVTVLDTLTCAGSGMTDADGDDVTLSYAWFVDGTEQSITDASLPLASYAKGQRVVCAVTPNDGSIDGPSISSAPMTISNAAPTAPVVELTPDDASSLDDLTCEITEDAVDVDGDRLTYVVEWTRDGGSYTGDTTTTIYDGDTVPSSATSIGEEWICTIAADDGEAEGPAGESDEIVITAPPSIVLTGACDRDVDYFCGGNCTNNTAAFADAYCVLEGYERAGSYTTHDSGVVRDVLYYNWRSLGSVDATPTSCSDILHSPSYGTGPGCTCVSELRCE